MELCFSYTHYLEIFLTVNSDSVCLVRTCISNRLPGDMLADYWPMDHTLSSNILGNFPLGVSNKDKHDDKNTKETIEAV